MKHRRKNNCPKNVVSRAIQLINDFNRGVKNYSLLRVRPYLKINIGIHWRLLSKDGGITWLLLTHQRYEKEIVK